MRRIVCFHLYNDYSGSPKVLKMVLEGLLAKGERIDLITSRGGVLDEIDHPGLRRRFTYGYRFSPNPALTMARYALAQVLTFAAALSYAFRRDTVFYVNTILPVGPALAGRLMGKRVVYHYHENAFVKGAFYRLLAWAMQRLASRIVCVSAYQASFLKRKAGVKVVPNALPPDFVARLRPDPEAAFGRKTVLMLSSLKEYKGTREFIELSRRLPQYRFVLVVNDTQENIDNYLKDNSICLDDGGGLTIFPRQADVAKFYNNSTVVVNLSDKERFIETFGLTALEAMTAGLPVIVPTVGGIAEMVADGENGYRVDVADLDEIARRIESMMTDGALYAALSSGALRASRGYDAGAMVRGVGECFE